MKRLIASIYGLAVISGLVAGIVAGYGFAQDMAWNIFIGLVVAVICGVIISAGAAIIATGMLALLLSCIPKRSKLHQDLRDAITSIAGRDGGPDSSKQGQDQDQPV